MNPTNDELRAAASQKACIHACRIPQNPMPIQWWCSACLAHELAERLKTAEEQSELPPIQWRGYKNVPAENLTKREKFVRAAMQGILANHKCGLENVEQITGWAIEQADATLKAMEQPTTNSCELEGEG